MHTRCGMNARLHGVGQLLLLPSCNGMAPTRHSVTAGFVTMTEGASLYHELWLYGVSRHLQTAVQL
jgi:hypothetical protein